MKYQYHQDGTKPAQRQVIFVFGSNESGVHGAGAAKAAKDYYGAIYGIGFGPQGESWAIPTKNWKIQSLDLDSVKHYVDRFKEYAASSSDKFFVTRIGCGLSGFKDIDIAPLFIGCSTNCNFPEQWKEFLEV